MTKSRCPWNARDELLIRYHDEEWGVTVHDDRTHFEFLTLDGFQAGLSWSIVLKKRENFRDAFDGFDPEIIARYSDHKLEELAQNAGIIRNRMKIKATVKNAKVFLNIQKEFGSFDTFIWDVNGPALMNQFESLSEIPASTTVSDRMSKELKQRGFSFVGTTICYAYMQSAGMVNDHIVSCFRYKECLV